MKKFFFNYLFFAIILCNVCNLSHAQSIDSAMLYTPPQFEYEGGLLSFVQAHLELNDKMFSQNGDTVKCTMVFSVSDSGVLQFDKSYEQFDIKTFCNAVYTMLKQSTHLWKPALLGTNKINSIMGITFAVQHIDKEQNIIYNPEILDTDTTWLANVFYNEGTRLLNDKKHFEAIPFLEKATEINSSDDYAIYNLGVCKLALGDTISACELWWQTISLKSKIANKIIFKYCPNKFYFAKNEDGSIDSTIHFYTIIEQMPEFPGGANGLINYIQENFRYPTESRLNNVMGTVYLTFIILADGTITRVKIKRGIPGGEDLEQEAIRLVKSMPNWIPGKQNGKFVNVQFQLPIKCQLTDYHK